MGSAKVGNGVGFGEEDECLDRHVVEGLCILDGRLWPSEISDSWGIPPTNVNAIDFTFGIIEVSLRC